MHTIVILYGIMTDCKAAKKNHCGMLKRLCSDDDSHDGYGQNDFAAAKTGGQRNRADGCLYGCFGQVGDGAEQPLF